MKKKILFIFLPIFLLMIAHTSLAYNGELTHPGITEQVVDFYNLNNSIKINSADRELIIQGSIDEDIEGRPLNHFYDPTRNMGINNYRNAIEWVTEENNGNEFTWGKSIKKYAEGDREGALIGLGHILHLVEDMTVPDHTRNDPHLGEGGFKGLAGTGNSPYEDWVKDNETRDTMSDLADHYKKLNLKPQHAFDSIEEYFMDLALYSNNNYVSPDTISDSQYPGPEVVEKKNNYAYSDDSYFNDRHKIYIEYYSDQNKLIKTLINKDRKDFSVLEEYFPRLVKMAILSGAGVVEMFFTEAENARAEYLEAERIKQEEITAYETEKNSKLTDGGFFSKIWYRVSYAVTDTTKAVASAFTNTANAISSAVYNGGSYAVNLTKNNTKALTYTGTELATVGAKKVKKAVVSSSEKVILYVKTNAPNFSNLVTPAVAYTPPVSNSAPTLTPTQIAQLVTILKTSSDNDKSEETVEKTEPAKKKVHSSGGNKSKTTTSTTTDDIMNDVATTTATTTTATTTTISEAVSAPTVLLVENITNTTPTTTILFSGTSTPGFIISEDLTFTSTTTDSEGNWLISIPNINAGTTTLNFFAEPDILHASSTSYDSSTGVTTIINYVKSEATEAMIFVGAEDILDIEVTDPTACESSLLTDRCLIATTSLEMSWTSNSAQLDHYVIILNGEVDEALITTDTSAILELDDEYENIIEIFAVNTLGEESDRVIYEVIVYTFPVVINEVVWMGTGANWADEWLELYNRTPYDIDLSTWSLVNEDEINISLTGTFSAEDFYLLERTDDDTISDIPADQIYTGNLNNDGSVLSLYFGSILIDQTPVGAWPAGNNTYKGTMERRDVWVSGIEIGNWITNLDYFCNGLDALGNRIIGTPDMPNSSTYPPVLI